MARIFPVRLCTCLLCFVILSAGCAGSPPARFYQLSSLRPEGTPQGRHVPQQASVVAVGPLRIPDYLDRHQIVTRSSANELSLAEFDRWAGSLERDAVRVVTEDLSALLPRDRFMVIPWFPVFESAEPSEYRIEINLTRFEGAAGGSVLLKAQWGLFHRERGLLLRRESEISEAVRGAGYGAVVEALSSALAGLSREIADTITAL